MSHLNCPSGLAITVTRSGELIEHRPRCARPEGAVELFVSAQPRGGERSPAPGAQARAAWAMSQEDG